MSASTRILRMKHLASTGREPGKLPFSASHLYDIQNPKSPKYDPTFPKPIRIGSTAAVGWVESEIDAWLKAQIEASRGKAA